MSLRRKLVLLAMGVMLSACGFHPIYGEYAESASKHLTAVHVAEMPKRQGQLLKAAIEDSLNPNAQPTSPEYELRAEIRVDVVPLSFKEDGTVTRYRIKVVSPYRLIRLSDAKEIEQGSVQAINSYNVSEADYSTYAAQQDGVERAIQSLGEKYFLRLSAFFEHQRHP